MTTDQFYPRQGSYLAKYCQEKIAKDNMPRTYPAELKDPHSPFQRSIMDDGNSFESYIEDRLQDLLPDGIFHIITESVSEEGHRTKEGRDQKERDTFQAMLNPNVQIISNGRIGPVFEQLLSEHTGVPVDDDARISEPDIIILGEEPLPNGMRPLTFVDVKHHSITTGKTKNPKTLDHSLLNQPWYESNVGSMDFYGTIRSDDWVQLAHYYRHGQTLGLVDHGSNGTIAGIIGKEEVVVWGNLEDMYFRKKRNGVFSQVTPLTIYDDDFANAIKVVVNARARDKDPSIAPIAQAEWKTDCSICPWRTVCKEELQEHGNGGHITLLAGVTVTVARSLYRRGVTDVTTLAQMDPFAEQGDLQVQRAIYAARVKLAGSPYLRADEPKKAAPEPRLPRADIEVDFDCESDETVYMWGVRITRRATGEVTELTFDDYTNTPEGEEKVFRQVWELFQELSEEATQNEETIRFYHYTAYERTQMRELAKTYATHPGIPSETQIDDFYKSGATVDMYPFLSKDVVWPTLNHSIKTLAQYTGFTWRDETPGGDQSMLWYRAACSDPDPQQRENNIARLREYNIDDVRAQTHLRDWIENNPLMPVETLALDNILAAV